MLSKAIPWHCLVCCASNSTNDDLPTNAWKLLQNLFDIIQNKDLNEMGPHQNPPKYVLNIISGEETNSRPPEDIQGVLIIAPKDKQYNFHTTY